MFDRLVRIILRYRMLNLVLIFILTCIMAYKATQVSLSYEFAQMLPSRDSTNIFYQDFKKVFGEDGAVMFIGIQDNKIFDLDEFDDWYDLTYRIKDLKGIKEVVSLAKVYQIVKNDSTHRFDFDLIVRQKPTTQAEVDSLRKVILSQPFYDGILYNSKTGATLMMVTLDDSQLNTSNRFQLIREIKSFTEEFSHKHDVKIHYSGLPYIRTTITELLQKELVQFIFIALAIATIILLLFFRSLKAAAFTMAIVIINVIWVLGLTSIFGFKITVLTGIIPPLIIIIVVENCIFLLNKYHHEFKLHGNKIRALSRTVQRLSAANLMTNATTAAGFATFAVTGNKILVEFGILAAVSIMFAYLLTLFLLPIIFSYLRDPQERHIRHLEKGIVGRIIENAIRIVETRRNLVYTITVIIFLGGLGGVFLLRTTGRIVDDISHKNILYKDLMFLEDNFGGAMPFEIVIDTEKKRGVMRLSTLEKMDQLEEILQKYNEFSRPISMVDILKYSRQAFYRDNPSYYGMPNNQELNFMVRYMPRVSNEKKTIINSFIDTNLQVARISTQMANIGTREIEKIKNELRPEIDSLFNPQDFRTHITGTSIVYLEGTNYLVRNLATSLALAIILIVALMALLFTSFRMILISMVPNLIPLVMTAGMMGYLGITIKPSTILVFSIALGISVDNAIHFLSRYRLYLIRLDWRIRDSVIEALRETGFSMIYSSVVLFFGFGIFSTSSFGGTQAMGYLISFTLLMALLSNLFVLPSLLLTLDKRITTRSFKEPLVDIFDEEVDIELEELEIENTEKNENNNT